MNKHVFGLAVAAAFAGGLMGQASPEPLTWTAMQDRQNMMDQLGITALRPGPSGSTTPGTPNMANYDPAKANPYPDLPDALTLKNGKRVTTGDMWWKQQRPEIVEEFDREVLGRVPKNAPKVTWEVKLTTEATVGGVAVIGKQLVGHVDNTAYPAITVDIAMNLVLPKDAKKPVPVLMMFGGGPLPGAPAPSGGRGGFPGGFGGSGRGPLALGGSGAAGRGAFPGLPGVPSTQQLIADGWGYASINPASIQADNGAGLTRGVIGLVNKGQARQPDDWGSLRAWAWGASRGLDYLETVAAVDPKHVGIEGVSRYGKAALVTMAYDTRFGMVLVGSSGEGGAKPHRRNFGEAVENLTGSGEYHWMAGNFLKYGASDAKFGAKTANDIPVDSNELIALCAPRPTFISYGVPEKGDANWLDHQGSYMATVAAGAVFRLLGAHDIGDTRDYRVAAMPGVNVGMLDGELAWRQHDGGHEDQSNMKYFIAWADKLIKHPAGN